MAQYDVYELRCILCKVVRFSLAHACVGSGSCSEHQLDSMLSALTLVPSAVLTVTEDLKSMVHMGLSWSLSGKASLYGF